MLSSGIGLPKMNGQSHLGELGTHTQEGGTPHPEDSPRPSKGKSSGYPGDITGSDRSRQGCTDRLEGRHRPLPGLSPVKKLA